MNKTIEYNKQGDGKDSWIIRTFEGEELIDIDVVYERPYQWGNLRLGLMGSNAFLRILSNPSQVNMVAYGALQTVLSTEGSEQHLLQMISLTMPFTQDEKDEINAIFESNNFTIKL